MTDGYATLTELATRVNARPRKDGKPYSIVVGFRPSDGDSSSPYFVALTNSAMDVGRGPHPKTSAVLSGSGAQLEAIISGRASASHPISTGDVIFTGSYLALIRLEKTIMQARRAK
jgi:hypothetical protein